MSEIMQSPYTNLVSLERLPEVNNWEGINILKTQGTYYQIGSWKILI